MTVKSCSILVATLALLAAALTVEPVGSHPRITTSIVFNKEIFEILKGKCFQCHTEGNLAMSLTTYRDARPWARAIREEVLERRMPPWSAVGGHGQFANDLTLTQREVDLLVAWIDGGVPSGVLKLDEDKPPAPVNVPEGWEHGAPDLVRAPESGHVVEAGSAETSARFVVPTGLSQPRWVRAVGFKPGDRRVVRSASFSIEGGHWIGAWTPWHGLTTLPDGVGYVLPAGARIVMDVQYRGADETITDRSEVGLYFAPERPAHTATNLVIEPRAAATSTEIQRLRGEMVLPSDTVAFAVWPEISPTNRSLEISAIKPDGVIEPLLWVNSAGPGWRTPYLFRDPITLSRGTKIAVTAYAEGAKTEPVRVVIAGYSLGRTRTSRGR
jgi:hypothetical protein